MKKILMIFSVVFLSALAAGGLYFLYTQMYQKRQKSDSPPKTETQLLTENKSVFPSVDERYFQDFLKNNDFNTQEIDENIISALIQDIIRRINASGGQIEFSYQYQPDFITIDMKYTNENVSELKSFEISINSL
ncbi:hypothetical protein V2E24_02285 [Mycoplasmopsis ciconiae]|uniref:Uncharacterized protein n=1 Tax=Mycoplasmopsis ciconiae TaxID=561067 RepID=A0ABU7MLI7_9BACT|nr:hypothetical protein [Mycoplasmopsis ciconiae]